MKKFIKAGILVVGAILTSQIAQAQFTANDLYVGFTGVGAVSNYVINLGAASTITGSSSVVDLSSDFSLSVYDAVLDSATSISMGVVGGKTLFPSTYDLYATTTRSGGAGDPSVAGSVLSLLETSTSISQAANDLARIGFPAAGTGTVLGASDGNSWSVNVLAPQAGTYYGDSGVDPMTTLNAGIAYEDLWTATAPGGGSGSFSYLGYFTIDAADSTLTYTPSVAPAPEPTTFSLFGGGALLLGYMSWRRVRKTV